MKNNQLVLLDTVVGFFLLPLCILIRIFRKLIQRIVSTKYEGTLIIKFLGAGNFLAIKNDINGKNVDIVTAKSNLEVLKNFNIGNKAYIIDDTKFLSLLFTSSVCCFKLFFKNYHQVINLETESKFAKFLTAMTSAKILSGVTNVHKSYIDYWLYDRYLVNPLILNKSTQVSQLMHFSPVTNTYIESAISEHRQQFKQKALLDNIKNITISPTCSNTDHLRRLSNESWIEILNILSNTKGVDKITVIFPSENDPQFQSFIDMHSIYSYLNVRVTSYEEFINEIEFTDLLLTVDSQALHLRQQFNKVAIAIYGPTSPFGVNLKITTYPITQSLICSPCTHKYLRLPCENLAPCMFFNSDFFEIFLEINR
jgi:ADP-heptose:LPS heptosyltransferase